MKKGIVLVGLVLSLSGCPHLQKVSAPVQAIIAPEGSIAPTVDFLKAYDEYKKLSDEIAVEQRQAQNKTQNKIDISNGMAQRLTQAVPKDYTFDINRRVFIPNPKTTVAPTPEKKE